MSRRGNNHRQETPSQRWARLLRRMLRAEVRASTLSLLIILVWVIFLIQVWRDEMSIFGN